MKRITALVMFALGVTLFSCSDDENQNSGGGELKISGQVMAPNNQFPVSRALVKVYEGNQLIATKTTDALGNFTVDQLPKGPLRVELSKGKFKRTLEVDLQSDYTLTTAQRNFDTFPKIGVVKGSYDAIEDILVGIGVVDDQGAPAFDIIDGYSGRQIAAHVHNGREVAARSSNLQPNVEYNAGELLNSAELLAQYDILFFNCGNNDYQSGNADAMNNLRDFVSNGGIVYATDWMYTYIQGAFTEYLTFAQPNTAGTQLPLEATLGSADLEAWLEAQGISVTPTVTVEGFLSGWQMVGSHADNVDAWVIAQSVNYSGATYTDKPLAYTFAHECGGVFYSSFHTHGNYSASAAIDQMMSYFVFELSGLGLGCSTSE
jgi:hypothetical protein